MMLDVDYLVTLDGKKIEDLKAFLMFVQSELL